MNIANLLPLIIFALGIFLLLKLRFFFILHPGRVLKCLFRGGIGKENISSLLLALAGTLGVGNIVGVASGIAVGGAGSVLWLLISAPLSAVIKYAEGALSSDCGESDGIIGIIRRSFPYTGRGIALIYTLLCLGLCFLMGNALQARAIAESLNSALGFSPSILLLPIAFIVGYLTLGGGGRIRGAIGIIIPVATIVYMILCMCVIIPNLPKLPTVINEIFSSAFSPRGAAGGFIGTILSKPITEGFARGILSNEAGAGTSSLAHATSSKSSAAAGGLLGACEVLFDTVLLCSLTAFTILLGRDESFRDFGDLCDIFTAYAGRHAALVLFLLTAAFAISTILCWFYYGRVCFRGILGRVPELLYFTTFLSFSLFGLFIPSEVFIRISDLILFFMTLIVSAVIIKNCDRIRLLSQKGGVLLKNSDKGCGGDT